VPEPDDGTGNDTVESRGRHAAGFEICPDFVDRGGEDIRDHPRSEGVPVVWHIAPSDTRWIDRHDEIPSSGSKISGHAEGTVLACNIKVEVLAIDSTSRDAHP
jgi:hypothetical protein